MFSVGRKVLQKLMLQKEMYYEYLKIDLRRHVDGQTKGVERLPGDAVIVSSD